jgi:hypothetical protein
MGESCWGHAERLEKAATFLAECVEVLDGAAPLRRAYLDDDASGAERAEVMGDGAELRAGDVWGHLRGAPDAYVVEPDQDPQSCRVSGSLPEAVPRIYQITPDISDRRATQQDGSQAVARPTALKRVTSPPVGTFSAASDVTDSPNRNRKPW